MKEYRQDIDEVLSTMPKPNHNKQNRFSMSLMRPLIKKKTVLLSLEDIGQMIEKTLSRSEEGELVDETLESIHQETKLR